MGLKIIGAGFGRTGTLSLKNALEQLGFDKCYHMLEVFQNPGHHQRWLDIHHGGKADWDDLFQGYQASVDWPSCNFWREQMAYYPDAKVILSLRDADSWHKSVMNTIYPSSYESYAKAKAAAEQGAEMPPIAEGRLPPCCRSDLGGRVRWQSKGPRTRKSSVRGAQRGGDRQRPRGTTVGLSPGRWLGTAVRVSRRAGARRAVSEGQYHRRLSQVAWR